MDLKKEKKLIAVVSLFGAICLAGIVFCVIRQVQSLQTQKQIQTNQTKLQKLAKRGKQIALSAENLDRENANFQRVKSAIDQKVELLDTEDYDRASGNDTSDPQTFRSNLTTWRDKTKNRLEAEKIAFPKEAEGLGFARYLGEKSVAPAVEFLPVLVTEQQVVGTLISRLIEARSRQEAELRQNGLLKAEDRAFLCLKAIRREARDRMQGGAAPTDRVSADEMIVVERDGLFATAGNSRDGGTVFASLRRKDATEALAFQVVFIGQTAVLRNFVAAFSSPDKAGKFKYPIYVRDVAVVPANAADIEAAKRKLNPVAPGADVGADAFGNVFGNAPAQSSAAAAFGLGAPAEAPAAPVKSVVRPEALSEFTVTLEYVKPVKRSFLPAKEETGAKKNKGRR